LIYQDLDDLKVCAAGINPLIESFDCSVFDGQYVTEGVSSGYLARIEQLRNDQAKRQGVARSQEVIELHNYQ